MMKSVIFDLDGTLADTSGDLINAANACFRGLGLGDLLSKETDRLTALRGGRAMLTLGFSRVEGFGEADILAEYPKLLTHYGAHIADETVLYPGVIEAVEKLRSAGYQVGICTNKPEGLAENLMKTLGVRNLFGALLGADSLPVKKPDPEHYHETVRRAGGDPKRGCLVGDTVTDRETARAAGVPSILVGFGPEGDVAHLEPEAILNHFDDLPDVVERLNL